MLYVLLSLAFSDIVGVVVVVFAVVRCVFVVVGVAYVVCYVVVTGVVIVLRSVHYIFQFCFHRVRSYAVI